MNDLLTTLISYYGDNSVYQERKVLNTENQKIATKVMDSQYREERNAWFIEQATR